MSPAPAHTEKRRRPDTRDRDASRDLSVQPIVPPSRRQSQQPREPNLSNPAIAPQHPYASPSGYRASVNAPNGYGRHSPNAPVTQNANALQMNGSEPYYTQNSPAKNVTNSRENMMNPGMNPPQMNGTRMGMYDRDQMQRGEHGEEGGHGRKQSLWSLLCCRS